jgi:hypothetical protein
VASWQHEPESIAHRTGSYRVAWALLVTFLGVLAFAVIVTNARADTTTPVTGDPVTAMTCSTAPESGAISGSWTNASYTPPDGYVWQSGGWEVQTQHQTASGRWWTDSDDYPQELGWPPSMASNTDGVFTDGPWRMGVQYFAYFFNADTLDTLYLTSPEVFCDPVAGSVAPQRVRLSDADRALLQGAHDSLSSIDGKLTNPLPVSGGGGGGGGLTTDQGQALLDVRHLAGWGVGVLLVGLFAGGFWTIFKIRALS